MRFMVAKDAAQPGDSVFVIDGEEAANLTAARPDIGPDLTVLAAGGVSAGEVRQAVLVAPRRPVSALEPCLPIARPGKIICLGLNYLDHIKEGGRDVPEYPVFFMRASTSLTPAGGPIERPAASETLDYEAELMVVIGRGGRGIAAENALQHVFGYTLFNDATVRAYQRRTHQWTPGKNFDATGAVGPVVVTADALPAGAAGLAITCRVNGETLQSASTSDMLWPVAEIVAAVSEFATLEPGDLIATGTPPGVGFARTPPRWLVPGDVVEVEIEAIGVCRNQVVAQQIG